MDILLTNDDGIYAPGIKAIAKALKGVGRVTVVAPDSERSSVGHGITLAHPIRVKKVKRDNVFFGYGISGTPADCVKFGTSVILKRKPDIVVSGINLGPNDGCSVFYSGTVAGAREAALQGIPAIAISLGTFFDPDFSAAAQAGAKLVKLIARHKIPKRTFLNVNVPNLPAKKIKGIKVTRQGMVPIHGNFTKRKAPDLREYYWMTGKYPKKKNDLSIDTYALQYNFITVTPIHCDLTDEGTIEKLSAVIDGKGLK